MSNLLSTPTKSLGSISRVDPLTRKIEAQLDMTSQDQYRLTHIFKLLGSRIIPAYFFNQNPKEFCKWQMNACRQTALITAYFFKQLLESFQHTDVEVTLWDGEFKDAHTPWYNHAWVTAIPKNADPTSDLVFLDLARISTYPIVEFATCFNIPEAVSPALRACGTVTLKMEEMDYDVMLATTEYYTGKKGIEVCQDVEKMMLMYSYDLKKFPWESNKNK